MKTNKIKKILKRIEAGCNSSIYEQYEYSYAQAIDEFLKSRDKVYFGKISDRQKAEFWILAGFKDGRPDMSELAECASEAYLDNYKAMYE